jgi:eukaryotic-like serine/threonine-protein kinase
VDTEYLIGQQIDGYRIIKHIDRGGMADVYLAEDVDLKRKVALKIMLDTLSIDAQFVQRFRREAQTVARLNHPNIVQVYTVGMTATQSQTGQRPYIAMRYIEGGSLRDKLQQLAQRKKLLKTEQALNIVRQIALALIEAHKTGIIHRDLKPGNVLIRPDGIPVLVDLGIASVNSGPKLTQTGSLVGTPAYMSPEQVRGIPLDGRSDLYSLGVILYEMLAGRRPFESEELMAVLHKQVYEKTPPLNNYRPDLSPQIVAFVTTCLQKEPANRFPNAEAMIAAIDRLLRLEGSEGPNPQLTEVLTHLHDSALISRPQIVQQATPSPANAYSPAKADSPKRKVPLWAIISLLALVGVVIAAFVLRPFDTFDPPTRPPREADADLPATDVPSEPTNEAEAETAAVVNEPAVATDEPTATAPPTETAIPATATLTPTPAPTATQTPIPPPESVTWELGRSSNNQTILLTQIGSGPKRLIFVSGVHGNEPNSRDLVTELMRYFQDNLTLVSPNVSLYFLPTLNPDGMVTNDRYTPGGVDLNRNWDTPTWLKDSPEPGGTKQNSGGARPFSEPETAALSNFLLGLLNDSQTESVSMIIYHHHSGVPSWGSVQPGYIQYGVPVSLSIDLAQTLTALAGYSYMPYWDGSYTPTGEIIQWSAVQGIAAVDVELARDKDWDEVPDNRIETVLQTAVQSVIGLMK